MRPRPPHEHMTRLERREFNRWKSDIVEKRGGVCERCGTKIGGGYIGITPYFVPREVSAVGGYGREYHGVVP